MSTTELLTEVLSEVKKLRKEVKSLTTLKEKETWVKASIITDLTGWDNQGMRRAREHGYVKYKDDKVKGRVYLLESINEVHKK
jgi:hypothetical protein